MAKACPQATSLYLVLCPDADIPPPVGEPEEVGWPGNDGSPGNRLTFQDERPTRSLNVGKRTKTLSSRSKVISTVMMEGLIWQVASSDRTRVPKLPVLGLVAGLTCYFLSMF